MRFSFSFPASVRRRERPADGTLLHLADPEPFLGVPSDPDRLFGEIEERLAAPDRRRPLKLPRL